MDPGQYDHLSYGRIREQCKQRRRSRLDSTAVSETRLAVMGADGSERASAERNAMEISMPLSGKKGRPPMDMVDYLNGSRDSQATRWGVDAIPLASVAERLRWSAPSGRLLN